MFDPLLEIENLSVSFAVGGVLLPAVKDLTLALHPGEIVGVVGESGSGKSTALLAVMSYLPGNAVIESGRVLHGGVDLLRARRETLDDIRGRRVAMIYQDPTTALNPAMTVGAQISEVLARHLAMAGARARERTHELLRLVQLDDPSRVAAAHPHQLSGGMQQRVMIAMALAGEPDVLLMDEPTTALDVIVQAHVLDLVRTLHRQIRSAIVFVSHNLAAVAQLADRIGVLYAGELMELGPARQVLEQPSHPYTRGLIAAVPRIAARQLRGPGPVVVEERLERMHAEAFSRGGLGVEGMPCELLEVMARIAVEQRERQASPIVEVHIHLEGEAGAAEHLDRRGTDARERLAGVRLDEGRGRAALGLGRRVLRPERVVERGARQLDVLERVHEQVL